MASISEQDFYDADPEEAYDEEARIEWSNLIFLPFHPIFKLAVLFSVIIKSILGPLQSVFPVVYCWNVMDKDPYLAFIKYFYWYCCDAIYGIDTFLHIVHRQVTDKAMRREYLPKSALLLLLDIVALIPFFRMIVDDNCPPTQLWPNLIAFTEFIVIYRIVEYFNLLRTHSSIKLCIGFTLIFICTVNCITCLWLLLTKHGLCAKCLEGVYDWRSNIKFKLNESDIGFTTYVYATVFVISFTFNDVLDDTKPSTIIEFVSIGVLDILGYLIALYIVLPKLFAESILRIQRICKSYPYVQMLVSETKRRNPSPKAYKNVENFYSVMWKKRSGITHIPDIILELPRYLRIDIRQDLVWPVFYHSPTLRKTSNPFKRHICEYIKPDFKLPGEKFFPGSHAYTHLYYIKSGIVQILSEDEGTTPILSVTSGTIFGDISFFVPPLKRKVMIKCLTYCVVLSLSRDDYIRALHKYPRDRENILEMAKQRMKHARTLYTCKQHVRGLDRTEDEGVAWVKRRWWEVSDSIANWRRKNIKKDATKWQLPPEEAVYHCAKYIGQLVLCTDAQLQIKSLFKNVEFPWILVPHSPFVVTWNKIVLITVFLVLITYPPNLTRPNNVKPTWFRFFLVWTDLVYVADLCISLLTAVTRRENAVASFASVMFARCKTFYFALDVLATVWIEYIVVIIGKPQYFNIAQFNRLIKIYMLFTGEYMGWDITRNPMINIRFRVVMINFSFCYIVAYIVYHLHVHIPDMTTAYFFGVNYCDTESSNGVCDPGANHILGVAMSWTMEKLFSQHLPLTLIDVYMALLICLPTFLISMYCKAKFISAIYLKYNEINNFQNFVSNLKKIYHDYKIHHDLLKRLDRYLICHWKHYKGANVVNPYILKDVPYDIYWKVQGEVAEKIIGESPVFLNADPALIRELACAARFLILPKNSTMFLFGVQCKNVTWVVQGRVKCEYYNEHGDLNKTYYGPGYMLSVGSVFLGKVSLRNYSSCTDCEILYIRMQEFYTIIKHYPNEWANFECCIEEFGPMFDDMFKSYLQKHRDNQDKLRDRLIRARRSTIIKEPAEEALPEPKSSFPTLDFWSEPSSEFMRYWMLFRIIIVMVSIISASLQGGSGAVVRWQLTVVGAFCDCVAWIDIIIKLFLAYYDDRGILIYDKKTCAIHYLTRSFMLDVIGALPWYEVIKALVSMNIDDDTAILINTFCKFAHLYILIGYFNYISDLPTQNFTYFMILKWQLVTILIMFGASHFLMTYCVSLEFDSHMRLVHTKSLNTCWMPRYFGLKKNVSEEMLHLLFAQSLNLAQSGFMGINFGRFHVDRDNLGVGVTLFILLLLFWYVVGFSITLLVLNSRGNTMFQHGVTQLRKFLSAERVDKKLIDRAIGHFSYWWSRTKGINIQHLTNERIGVVFRQDLSYYFLRRTLIALDTLLVGGESLGRHLASVSTQIFIQPGEDIIREMDLAGWIYIVHRGRVVISNNGKTITTLTKGSIFGVLNAAHSRPVRISAKAEGYADLLQITIKQFQDIINRDVRDRIARSPQAKMDYMATKKRFGENPYDTIQYLLRGRKTIQLPWMSTPMEARHDNWYSRWLYITWLLEPFVSAVIALIIKTLPEHVVHRLHWILVVCDITHLANFLCGFYSIELIVVENKIVKRRIGYRKMKHWGFYVDTIGLIMPLFSFFTNAFNFYIFQLVRLRHLYDFHRHFCRSFKSKTAPVMVKFGIVLLLLHATSCGWVYIACRTKAFPLDTADLPERMRKNIDSSQWILPRERNGGCARLLKDYVPEEKKPAFVVPVNWYDDYVIAMTYILLIHTCTAAQTIVAVSIKQIYYKIAITFLIYLIDVWLMSVAISFVYTRYREMYQYDYNVRNLTTYLKHSGLSPALLKSVKLYTGQLWRRQRGNWLPELAQQAPICLREDLFNALYMHHLQNPPIFRELPEYFRRQVVARLRRNVIFPGKCIVQEGDMYPCIYFIHEGEVEKWYIDKSGENRQMSLLTTNGYFGTIPGLFPNVSFQFTYYTRTVVDLVYLRLQDWQDLLDGYPKIKHDLYTSATQMRKEFGNLGKLY